MTITISQPITWEKMLARFSLIQLRVEVIACVLSSAVRPIPRSMSTIIVAVDAAGS